MSWKAAKTNRNPVTATKPERKEWTGQSGDIVLVPLEDVHLPEDYLEPSQVSVAEIAESIQTFGLIHPIAVRLHLSAFGKRRETMLIAGASRLAAYKLLGETAVPCTYFPDDEVAVKYIRMSENIFRADITVLDKADKIAEYLDFLKEHQIGDFGQHVQKQGRPLSDAGKAAKQLPIAAKTIESRKKKIDRYLTISQSILDEHKPLIREKGLANNQWALLQIANEEDAYQKYKAIQRLGVRRTTPRAAIKKRMNRTMPVAEHAKYEELLAAWEASPEFKVAWRKAEPEHRDRFYNEVMCGLSHYDSDQAVRLVQRAFAGREKILVRHLQRLGMKHGYLPSAIIDVWRRAWVTRRSDSAKIATTLGGI
jgi:ParB/RepB/Spo0J family partition protein